MYIPRLLGRRAMGSLAAWNAHVAAAAAASKAVVPRSLTESQDFARFTIGVKRDDGGVSPVHLYISSYSQASATRYVQLSYVPQASEAETDARALALQLTLATAHLPMAGTAAVVAEAEDEFSPNERAQLYAALQQRLTAYHSDSKDFVYSHDLKARDETYALGAVLSLKSLFGNSLQGKLIGISHFDPRKSELLRAIDQEGGKVVWTSEHRGACVNPAGIEVNSFVDHYATHGTVKGFDGGATVPGITGLLHTKKDVVIANTAAALPLVADAGVVAEADCFCLSPTVKVAGQQVPSTLFSVGDAVSAFLTHSLAAKSVPAEWSPPAAVGEAVDKLVKSKAKGEKKQKEVFLTAAKAISDYAVGEVLRRSKDQNLSLRTAALLAAVFP